MNTEVEKIKALFATLCDRDPINFPRRGGALQATTRKGVYIVLGPRGRVLHVGNTPRGKDGINQRLRNHLYGSSSFARQYLEPNGVNLRDRYKYKYIEVENPRYRALLQAYAIGALCPAHIGSG